MNNYQLYKTSVLLGGQMKMDLILNFDKGITFIEDFHLTPISKYVPYNRYSEQNLLKYEHQNNICNFYKNIISSFYENFSAPQMNHNWPIVDESKIYDDTFFSGCSRAEYNTYGKQFEYFCPLWLEQIKEQNYLAFDINLSLLGDSRTIASKTVYLKPYKIYPGEKNIKKEKHNNFIKYIINYFKYINILGDGCDDIININLSKQTAHLRGLEVTSGNIISKDLNDLVYNLMVRERPLLEFDYMITSSFKNTKTIVPNLFNFNICFNIKDIFASNVVNQLMGKPIIINIISKIVDENNNVEEILEKRDLYTNYEYIPKQYNTGIKGDKNNKHDPPSIMPNVLDYMHDDKYINHMDKNKIVQKIPHWQLINNDKYIFNLYEGFRGFLLDDKGEYIECYNRYADTPDVIQSRYSKALNNLGWANSIYMDQNIYNNATNVDNLKFIEDNFARLRNGWVNYLYYNKTDIPIDIYVLLGIVEVKEMEYIKINLNPANSIIYQDIVMSINSNYNNAITICSTNLDNLTFASVKNILKQLLDEQSSYPIIVLNTLIKLYKLMNNLKPLPLISINNRLSILLADSPDQSSNEIDYKKLNNSSIYILRYDGKIKPNMFIPDKKIDTPKNYIYNKKRLDDIQRDKSNFMNYAESKYSPLYPSIDYWSFDKQIIDYDNPPKYVNPHEYKWFKNSKILYTVPEMKFNVYIHNNGDDKNIIDKEIINRLKSYMNINNDTAEYIFNLYNITYDLIEYDNISKIYNYNIIMKFK